ncbi:hypothetical protein BaRGS_00028877 [Batillaria attramentaria]|uniref:Uncharacterized protein n=1 Tax=Batillaria attramentaria TaxID=370345 RepID=A0ABD0JXU6_9CAEN
MGKWRGNSLDHGLDRSSPGDNASPLPPSAKINCDVGKHTKPAQNSKPGEGRRGGKVPAASSTSVLLLANKGEELAQSQGDECWALSEEFRLSPRNLSPDPNVKVARAKWAVAGQKKQDELPNISRKRTRKYSKKQQKHHCKNS